MKTKTIGILCGGISNEREVSLRSGENVYRILSTGGYRAVLIDLQEPKKLEQILHSNNIDIVFNTLHGLYGEDGTLQGDLNFLGIPYTGCGPISSGVAMNKLMSKLIAKSLGVKTPEYQVLNIGHTKKTLDGLLGSFSFPLFVKPMNGGSSRDSYLLKDLQDVSNLLLDSQKSYLVEEFVEGVEVTSGVLSAGEERVIFPILELIPSNNFYDYEAKYTEGKTKFICPASISADLTNTIGSQSMLMHEILKCCGATRSDFLIHKESQVPYFLEINTSSGMTKLSDIPAEAEALGWSEIELCEKILKSCYDTKF